MDPSAGKRLCIHIGTPKTGTSALQWFLYENRDALLARGILYPTSIIASPRDPKQQLLLGCIHAGNGSGLDAALRRMTSEQTPSTESIIVSSEGFYHHTGELTPRSWNLLRHLVRMFSVRIIVFLRPQADYIESMYRQYMKNPKGINEEYGSRMTIQELMARPKLQQNLDYHNSLLKWAAIVGEENIMVRIYSKNIIDEVLAILGLRDEFPRTSALRNTSLTREMAEVLRRINPILDNQKRNVVIGQMEAYLSLNRGLRDMPILSPEERRSIAEHNRTSNALVARTWLSRGELFSDSEVSIDDAWEPLQVDHEQMKALLHRIAQ
jgi:hypothetical protein